MRQKQSFSTQKQTFLHILPEFLNQILYHVKLVSFVELRANVSLGAQILLEYSQRNGCSEILVINYIFLHDVIKYYTRTTRASGPISLIIFLGMLAGPAAGRNLSNFAIPSTASQQAPHHPHAPSGMFYIIIFLILDSIGHRSTELIKL